jgi:hypothetical protein
MVPVADAEFAPAMDTYARFGNARQPTRLRMGESHAQTCAKANNLREGKIEHACCSRAPTS